MQRVLVRVRNRIHSRVNATNKTLIDTRNDILTIDGIGVHLLDHKSLLKRGPLFCSKPYHPENEEDIVLQSCHLAEKLRTPHGLEPWPNPIRRLSKGELS